MHFLNLPNLSDIYIYIQNVSTQRNNKTRYFHPAPSFQNTNKDATIIIM